MEIKPEKQWKQLYEPNKNIIVENNPILQTVFSDGSLNIRIQNEEDVKYLENCIISVRLKTPSDIISLLLTTNAIRKINCDVDISLKMYYTPYSRQDRVCNDNEAFSLEVFCDLINSQNYKKVFILDPHSNVTELLLNNVVVIKNKLFDCVTDSLPNDDSFEFNAVSPDLGASKKTQKLAKEFYDSFNSEVCSFNIYQFLKERNLETGEIIETKCMNDLSKIKGKNFYIIDDICNYGMTFINIAKILKQNKAGKIYLVVTHGIFDTEPKHLYKYFDKIYTTDSFCDINLNSTNLIIFKSD